MSTRVRGNLASVMAAVAVAAVAWLVVRTDPPVQVQAHLVTECDIQQVHVRPVGLLNER